MGGLSAGTRNRVELPAPTGEGTARIAVRGACTDRVPGMKW